MTTPVPSLGAIDLTKPSAIPNMYIAKPDRTIVGKLRTNIDIFTVQWNMKLGNISELSFQVPYWITSNHELIRNPLIDLLLPKYQIKVEFNGGTEWYVVDNVEEDQAQVTSMSSSNNTIDYKIIDCFSCGYELSDKIVQVFDAEGINLTTAMTGGTVTNSSGESVTWLGVLDGSLWDIGYVDPIFNTTYRTFNSSNTGALNETFNVAKTFGALVTWDTVNRKVNFYQQSTVSLDQGFRISGNKLMQQLVKHYQTDKMATRLYAYGNQGLSINSVNPTGSSYIEDYSYFMNGYTTDSHGNVTGHSSWMSDGLCQAIINYNNLVATKKTEYSSYLATLTSQQEQLTTDNNTLATYQTNLASAQNMIDTYTPATDYKYTRYDDNYAGATINHVSPLTSTYYYVVIANVATTTNITPTLDGVMKSLPSNTWTVLGKIENSTSSTIQYTGTGSSSITTMYVMITSAEYSATGNESDLITKYCIDYNQTQVNNQQTVVNTDNTNITNTNNSIIALQNELSVTNNFTSDQIKEWNTYIIEKTWTDSSYTDPQLLYNDALTQLADANAPQVQYQITLVNFMDMVDQQREWSNLVLGNIVTIDYPDLKDNQTKAVMTEIDINFDNAQITLTIANVLNVRTDEYVFLDMLYSSSSTSTTLSMNSYKWDNAHSTANQVLDVINNTWDATKRVLTAGASQSVTMDNRGITITEPDNANNIVMLNAGAIGLSQDGGKTYKTAITAQGVFAERLFGTLIAGTNLAIETDNNSFTVNEQGVTVDGAKLTITGGLPSSQLSSGSVLLPSTTYNGVTIDSVNGLQVVNSNELSQVILNATTGIEIQNRTSSTGTWSNVFGVDTNGNLYANDLITTALKVQTKDATPQTLIDAGAKLIDFSGFTQINGTINGTSNIYPGSVTGASIAADTITTTQLIVGDMLNYCTNPQMIDSSGNKSSADWTVTTVEAAGTSGGGGCPTTYCMFQTDRDNWNGNWFTVSPGDIFYIEAWVYTPGGSAYDFGVGLGFMTPGGVVDNWIRAFTAPNTTTTWTKFTGTVTAPSGHTKARVWAQDSTAGTDSVGYYFTNVVVRHVVGNEEVGTLDASKITTGTLTGVEVQTISGSSTVTLNNGQISCSSQVETSPGYYHNVTATLDGTSLILTADTGSKLTLACDIGDGGVLLETATAMVLQAPNWASVNGYNIMTTRQMASSNTYMDSGTYSAPSGSHTANTFYKYGVGFNNSFSVAPAVVGIGNSGNTTGGYFNSTFESITTTGFTTVFTYGTTTSATPTYSWIAVGH